MSNGRQVILKEIGHTVDFWNLQPKARMRVLTSFYDAGVIDESLYTCEPVDFYVGLGSPEMAKILASAMGLVLLGPMGLVWFVTRKVRCRRASQVSS